MSCQKISEATHILPPPFNYSQPPLPDHPPLPHKARTSSQSSNKRHSLFGGRGRINKNNERKPFDKMHEAVYTCVEKLVFRHKKIIFIL